MNLNLKAVLKSFSLSMLALLLSVTVLYAATTIGSNITTAGTLAVTGTATFSGLVKTAADYGLDASSAGIMNIGTTTATTINIGGSQALTKILGNASTTMVSLSGSLWVGGNATTTASNGNFVTQGSVGVASSSPYVALGVTGTTTSSAGMVIGATGSPINKLLVGTCTVTAGSITASSTLSVDCAATGVATGDKVFVTPYISDNGIVFVSASSTATNVIQVSLFNVGLTGAVNPADNLWSWMAIR